MGVGLINTVADVYELHFLTKSRVQVRPSTFFKALVKSFECPGYSIAHDHNSDEFKRFKQSLLNHLPRRFDSHKSYR
jgi:hypothetical protein